MPKTTLYKSKEKNFDSARNKYAFKSEKILGHTGRMHIA